MTLNRAIPAHDAPTQRIASWRRATIREWPGHVATSLRLWGCTFTCPGCESSTVAQPPADQAVRWADVVEHIDAQRQMLDGVVVTGGEPTLDPDLPSLLAALKDLDLDVRLDTNGSNPDVLAFLLAEQLIDSVALSIKAVPAQYRQVSVERDMPARVAECADILIVSGIDHEFCTDVTPGLVDPEELPRIARTLCGGRLYVLRQQKPTRDDLPRPFPDDILRIAATACSRFLPTIVRGLDIGED